MTEKKNSLYLRHKTEIENEFSSAVESLAIETGMENDEDKAMRLLARHALEACIGTGDETGILADLISEEIERIEYIDEPEEHWKYLDKLRQLKRSFEELLND